MTMVSNTTMVSEVIVAAICFKVVETVRSTRDRQTDMNGPIWRFSLSLKHKEHLKTGSLLCRMAWRGEFGKAEYSTTE